MNSACVIAVGTELTLGQSLDTNSPWLAGQLAAIGVRTTRHVTVPDDLPAIVEALREAANRSDVVLITGGLGPTDDDLTRRALADVVGVRLVEHAASLAQIRAFFAGRGRDMPEPNRVQALLPAGAVAIENSCGTAPGIRLEIAGVPCYSLPGVPYEMREMFQRSVLPALRAAAGGRVLRSRTLLCIGVPESDVGERLADLMQRGRNPEVGTAAQTGIIAIRVNATADDARRANAMLADAERAIRERLGQAVFGRDADTLASVTGDALRARGATLAVAESCTGGLVTTLLTDTPGSSAYVLGGVVAYADAAKVRLLGVAPELIRRHGAVSEPVAGEMAAHARDHFGASLALSLTGIAGPGGGTADKPVGLVYVGLATARGVRVRRYLLGAEQPRESIRLRAALAALDLVRLEAAAGAGTPPGSPIAQTGSPGNR